MKNFTAAILFYHHFLTVLFFLVLNLNISRKRWFILWTTNCTYLMIGSLLPLECLDELVAKVKIVKELTMGLHSFDRHDTEGNYHIWMNGWKAEDFDVQAYHPVLEHLALLGSREHHNSNSDARLYTLFKSWWSVTVVA